MNEPIRTGGSATIVQHCAVSGRLETQVRTWAVGEPRPYAQYPIAVSIVFMEPRKRRRSGFTITPDNRRFLTVEANGVTLYDSRSDVPCDMAAWETTARKWSRYQQPRPTPTYPISASSPGVVFVCPRHKQCPPVADQRALASARDILQHAPGKGRCATWVAAHCMPAGLFHAADLSAPETIRPHTEP
jgi:hypothetical protein